MEAASLYNASCDCEHPMQEKLHKQRVTARMLIKGKSSIAAEMCKVLIKTEMIL